MGRGKLQIYKLIAIISRLNIYGIELYDQTKTM